LFQKLSCLLWRKLIDLKFESEDNVLKKDCPKPEIRVMRQSFLAY
jgi:hypothetical protein